MMTPNEIEVLKEKVDVARCNYLAYIAYVIELDESIALLTGPLTWSNFPGANSEKDRELLLEKYEKEVALAMDKELSCKEILHECEAKLKAAMN